MGSQRENSSSKKCKNKILEPYMCGIVGYGSLTKVDNQLIKNINDKQFIEVQIVKVFIYQIVRKYLLQCLDWLF